MVRGAIRLAGTPTELKSLFGGGLIVSFSIKLKNISENISNKNLEESQNINQDLLLEKSQNIASQLGNNYTLVLDRETRYYRKFKYSFENTNIKVSKVFKYLRLQDDLVDFAITERSLEDVFISLARLN